MHSEVVPEPRLLKATGAPEVARLYKYFSLLRQVAHPGVVEIDSHEFSASTGVLRLVSVDGSPFGRTAFPDLATLTSAMTALSVTIGHLHELGIVHGHLTPSTITISRPDYRPVITDLTRARLKTNPNDPADDSYNLGRLLMTKLPKTTDPIRERISGDPKQRALLDALQRIASAAMHDDPLQRPSAREMAIQLRRLTQAPPAANQRRRPRHRQSVLAEVIEHKKVLASAAAVVGVLALSIGLSSFLSDAVEDARRPELVTPPLPAQCTPRPPASLVTDVDGDGCADAVQISDGTITVNGEVLEVGQEGDIVALGRWTDESPRTLVVLRPPSGRLFVFDAWPEGEEEVTPRSLSSIAGATGLTVIPKPDGTDMLQITTRDRRVIEVDPSGNDGNRDQ